MTSFKSIFFIVNCDIGDIGGNQIDFATKLSTEFLCISMLQEEHIAQDIFNSGTVVNFID